MCILQCIVEDLERIGPKLLLQRFAGLAEDASELRVGGMHLVAREELLLALEAIEAGELGT